MKKCTVAIVSGLILVSAILVWLYKQPSEFLKAPELGDYALVISVSKDAEASKIDNFYQYLRSFPGDYQGGAHFITSESSDYLFVRLNRHTDPDPEKAIQMLTDAINNYGVDGYSEFALLNDTDISTAVATSRFKMEVFP